MRVVVIAFVAISALIGVASVLVLVVGARQPVRAQVAITGGRLVVRFAGWDRLLTMRGRLDVAADHVASISVADSSELPVIGPRWPGVSVPNRIRAGSFGSGGERDLWDIRGPGEVLSIDLAPRAPYRRVILAIADPAVKAEELRAALPSLSRPG